VKWGTPVCKESGESRFPCCGKKGHSQIFVAVGSCIPWVPWVRVASPTATWRRPLRGPDVEPRRGGIWVAPGKRSEPGETGGIRIEPRRGDLFIKTGKHRRACGSRSIFRSRFNGFRRVSARTLRRTRWPAGEGSPLRGWNHVFHAFRGFRGFALLHPRLPGDDPYGVRMSSPRGAAYG
jgi:hypothetical protein